MRFVYSISAAAGVALTLVTLGASAEPAACRSPNPSDWPAPAQPYFMLVLDSSGSMDTDVSGAAPSCAGYPDNRSGHARCAVYNTIQAFSGLVNFGLATFATVLEGCTGSSCYSGCDIRTFSPDEDGCGPSNGIAVVPSGGSSYDSSVTQREGANILVPIDPVTDGSDVPDLLRWVDNDCTNSVEAAAEGYTPLGGVLRDIYRYFRYGWDRPDGAVSYSSPLDPSDPTCRSVNVILLTDGDEYCDPNTGSGDSGPAEEAARALAEGFRLAADDPARPLRRIPTYVINFAGGSVSDSNRIAEAGNTEESLFATNEADLSAALANIIAGAIKPEVCDNADNNCNGCTDEGYKVFCSRQWETASCCTWSTPAEREACLEDYRATIDADNPKGDRTQLPCWDPDTNGTSPETKWLCVDPGEACDDADNNCEWHYNQDPDAPGRTSEIDEGFTKCPDCPVTEICDGQDNDCDGSIDEIPGCTVCIPSSEVCDGRDNDCDGYIDEASDNASDIVIPCSLAATPGCQGERACGHRYTSVDGDPLTPGAVLDPPNGYGPCDAPTSEETCNGQDDDCDGLIDEGDLGTPCDPPVPAGRSGIVYQDAAHPDTICKQGTVPCGGVACQGAVGPQPEVCDGQDNDCDGVVDQAWDGSPLPFEGDTCGPCGVGTKQCIDGEQRCVIEGTAPQEVCNGIDDDCDGVIDDPPLADAPATLACWPLDASQCDPSDVCTVAGTSWCKPTLGACQSMGSLSSPCAPGSLICAGEQGWTCHQGRVPTSEICDGVDNDCNGQIDESLGSPVGDTCGENIGTCTTGTIYCNNGVLQCNGTGPSPEVCNGEDDNCNGEVDEGLALGEPCWDNVDTAGFPGDRTEGQCQPGHFVCDPEGSGELICDGGRGPEPEVCDGIDNDCDGNIDEAGPPPDGVDGTADPNDPTRHLGDECGDEEGVCEHGTLACVQGVVACQGGLGTQTEECDCVDNDCDGDIDEEPPALCSPGKSCVRFDDRCLCASPCASGEFPCPTGMECVRAKGSFDGDSGSFCVPEDPCGNCAARTVTDEQGNVECAPSYAAQDDNPVPVCVCKDEACHSPCFGIVCDKGQACVPTGWAAQTCREENCYFFGCSADQLCLDGICRTDPCADDPCDEDEVCKPDASYKKPRCTKTCAGVECEDTEHCVEGLCMPTGCDEPCTGTDVCRSNANGDSECGPSLCELQDGRPTCSDGSYCNPTTGSCGDDPCEGVHCPTGQSCLLGECVIPDGSVSGAGGGTDSPDGGKVPKVSGNWGVATGGGGCGCRHSSGTKASWLLLLAGTLLLRRRRRYGNTSASFHLKRGPERRTRYRVRSVPKSRSFDALALTGASKNPSLRLARAASMVLLVLSGCGEHAYCFDECDNADSSAAGSDNSGTGGLPSLKDGGSGASASLGDSGDQLRVDGCAYEGEEVCDGRDNDCNGQIDDGIDFTRPQNCGTCAVNCVQLLANVAIPICEPPDELDGQTPGTCVYEECAQDYYDFDPDVPGCEYFCDRNPEGTITEDLGGDDGCGRDDDCDGQLDEDVDTCNDIDNCGRCGHSCVVIHGIAECATSAEEGEACDESNTQCVIQECEEGYWDANGIPDDGCELECEPDGPEVCDGKDNDCDGYVDNTDPDLEAAANLGEACQGGALGICGDEDHTGVTKCVGGQIRCCDILSDDLSATNPELPEHGLRNGLCESEEGPQVVRPGELPETCNGLDDDCDGAVDDSPSEVGESCGTNVGTCTVGIVSCDADPDSPTFGTVNCVGATPPSAEICNGADDDCDGVIDGSALTPTVTCTQDDQCAFGARCLPRETGDTVCALATSDSGTSCQVPPPVPDGTTSACQAGTNVCRGGVLSCDGAVTRDPGTPDTCGVDQNCDGAVDNTDLSLVETCGSCSNNCESKGPNAVWSCDSDGSGGYECVQSGCAPNWYECIPDDGTACETYCQPTGAEVCNGVDDDCDCEIDEDVTADPRSACGVRSTVHPGCNPSVACVDGTYRCTFSDPDICGGSVADCAGTSDDTCDGKDNDCDGVIDNLFADQKGLFCTNTLGACVEHGVQACDPSTKQLVCDAPAPVPQAELCNGIDDDCDGYVDEVAADLGAGADDGEYVRPAVIALGSSGPWVFAYEASRPDATGARQGSGNGYFDAAPPGEGLDRTIACSGPGRLPWTNVSPWEVEQTCEAIGGRVCRVGEWQGACTGPSGLCDYGFLGCEAASDYTDGPFCNLGAYNGSQDALLPGASSDLLQCAAPWADVYSNELDEYDVTGNAREIVRCQKDRAVCTNCAQNCCSDAFSTVSGPPGAQQLCGNVSRRRLSGQPCESYRDCCNDDVLCNANGSCSEGICHNDNSASACVARGIACTDGDGDGNCDQYGGDAVGCCDDAPLSGGVCGGASALPHSVYPLLGGSYRTLEESSATCDYSFFKVEWDFRLFDTGFRCCFDVDPR